jgi:hypothetical protein
MADLLFSEGYGGGNALVFGTTGGGPVVIALGSSAIAPAPTGPLPLASGGTVLRCSARSPAPISGVAITYDNAVNRAPFRWAEAPWQAAAARRAWCPAVHRATPASQTDAHAACGTADHRRTVVATGWQPMRGDRRPADAILWSAASRLGTAIAERFQPFWRSLRPSLALPFVAASPWLAAAASPWRDLFRWARPALTARWGGGMPVRTSMVVSYGVAAPFRLALRIPWNRAQAPLPGVSPRPGDPPLPPRYVGDPDLLFNDDWPASLHLVFGRLPVSWRIGARVVIPVLRSYLVVNDVTLVRVSNALSLPALSISLSIDVDSWVWGWQASLPATALEDVLPGGPGEPVEFEATVNGVNFLLLAERITRDRRFAQARITVSGRGIAAELGDPYAPVVSRSNGADRTAQQLMIDALTVSGVGIGWSLDWQLTDWLVPAGAWSHSGSHIEACARIAEAAGGYVQASRNSRTLAILPRYPAAPWDWSGLTPDFSLPSAATTREAVEWLEKPAYNAVYISGEGMGILAHVTRAGTAGDLLAPMIVDALTTHADAARQRGLVVLADTGPQQLLTLETPIFTGVGIYPVGSFVSFSDGAESRLGIVRSVAINAALPRVRQTLEIECHE